MKSPFQVNSLSRNPDDLVFSFKEMADQLAGIGAKFGTKIIPYHCPSLPRFSSLDTNRKILSLEKLRVNLKIYDETVRAGYDLESPQLTWFALKELSLRPPSSLFNHITKENVIEVHDFSGVQIFRNFLFYDYCSYTLEELYCEPWAELFLHQGSSLPKIHKFIGDVSSGLLKGVRHLDIKSHIITEKFSQDRLVLDARMIYGAPLFDVKSGEPAATLVVETADILKSVVDSKPLRKEGPELTLL